MPKQSVLSEKMGLAAHAALIALFLLGLARAEGHPELKAIPADTKMAAVFVDLLQNNQPVS